MYNIDSFNTLGCWKLPFPRNYARIFSYPYYADENKSECICIDTTEYTVSRAPLPLSLGVPVVLYRPLVVNIASHLTLLSAAMNSKHQQERHKVLPTILWWLTTTEPSYGRGVVNFVTNAASPKRCTNNANHLNCIYCTSLKVNSQRVETEFTLKWEATNAPFPPKADARSPSQSGFFVEKTAEIPLPLS